MNDFIINVKEQLDACTITLLLCLLNAKQEVI